MVFKINNVIIWITTDGDAIKLFDSPRLWKVV